MLLPVQCAVIFVGGYSPVLSLGYEIKEIFQWEQGLICSLMLDKYMFVCFSVRSRKERAKDAYVIPFMPGNKVVALNWNKLALVFEMHLGAFASSWHMTFRRGWLQYAGLCFGSETGTQCTLQVPPFCSHGCGEDRGHPHGERKCCQQEGGVFWRSEMTLK